MKLQYYFMSMALMATACVSFTACDDDDPVDEPVYVIPGQGQPDITLTSDVIDVKIGAENKAALPVEQSGENVKAFSLNPEIAEIVVENGVPYIQAIKPGVADVVISDADNAYKNLTVHSYQNELTLNQNSVSTEALYATPATISGVKITSGNGDYVITSNNNLVTATVDQETGDLTIKAGGDLEAYTATVTVTDISGLSASVDVNVSLLEGGFTAAELADIKALTKNTLYAATTEPGNTPYYFARYENYTGAQWTNSVSGSNHTLGWDFQNGGYEMGRETIVYPATASVGQTVAGTLQYRYSTSQWYGLYDQAGNTQVVLDNAERIIVIWWYFNTERVQLDRAYIVYNK